MTQAEHNLSDVFGFSNRLRQMANNFGSINITIWRITNRLCVRNSHLLYGTFSRTHPVYSNWKQITVLGNLQPHFQFNICDIHDISIEINTYYMTIILFIILANASVNDNTGRSQILPVIYKIFFTYVRLFMSNNTVLLNPLLAFFNIDENLIFEMSFTHLECLTGIYLCKFT